MANSPAGTLYNSDIPLGFHLPQPLNKSLACGVPFTPTHLRGLTDPTTLNQKPLISRSFSFPSPLHPRTPETVFSPQVTSPKHSFGTQPLKPREMPRVLSHSSRRLPCLPQQVPPDSTRQASAPTPRRPPRPHAHADPAPAAPARPSPLPGATYRGPEPGRGRARAGAAVPGCSQPRGAGAGASGSGGAASPPGGGGGGGGTVPLPQAHIGSIVRRRLPLSGSPLPGPPLPPPLGPPPPPPRAAPRHERYRGPRLGRERRRAPPPARPAGNGALAPPPPPPGPAPSGGGEWQPVPLPEGARWYQPAAASTAPLPGLAREKPPSPRPPGAPPRRYTRARPVGTASCFA